MPVTQSSAVAAVVPAVAPFPRSEGAWSFLTSHGLVLVYVGGHPRSTGLEIAVAVGITERAVRKILVDLEAAGYIERERVGRRNRYRIETGLPLLRLGDQAVTVGELLHLLHRDADS